MAKPSEDQVFTQERYNVVVAAMDEAMRMMLEMGMSEAEAREWLHAFLKEHYFRVWRGIRAQ